ncbi:ADP-ribosylation [Schizophyllum commune H4-8]|uniref:PARP catalytic domain-containing protein n=1 Tax=Schizophyllum commune (strain H4-8 / FGSC 9210) TaxID=578458 RepID=D8QIC7_SCHCM|nr:ADP-ribosylation [Schizophyllum commune H4-8]KAI5885946.1 ADP-ribosylation [Schizophyllum commune H4-8]
MYNNSHQGNRPSDLVRNGKRGVEIGELFAQLSPSSPSFHDDLPIPSLHDILRKEPRIFCIYCGRSHNGKNKLICNPWCDNWIRYPGLRVVNVPLDHVSFSSVVRQFEQSWRHPDKRCPVVKRVLFVVSSMGSVRRYEEYQKRIEERRNFTAVGRPPGNENRRWHGTRRECSLGEDWSTSTWPCKSPTCSVCRIVCDSFDIECYKGRTGWGRFGRGIYTSSTSSKADDYSCNLERGSTTKVMILAKVVVGRGYKMHYNNSSLTAPPVGYDSVCVRSLPLYTSYISGQVLGETGAQLNYDEVVVYSNDAIRPAYLVLYD